MHRRAPARIDETLEEDRRETTDESPAKAVVLGEGRVPLGSLRRVVGGPPSGSRRGSRRRGQRSDPPVPSCGLRDREREEDRQRHAGHARFRRERQVAAVPVPGGTAREDERCRAEARAEERMIADDGEASRRERVAEGDGGCSVPDPSGPGRDEEEHEERRDPAAAVW